LGRTDDFATNQEEKMQTTWCTHSNGPIIFASAIRLALFPAIVISQAFTIAIALTRRATMLRIRFGISSTRHLQNRPWLAGPISSLLVRSECQREIPRAPGTEGSNGKPFQLALRSAAAFLTLVVLSGGTGLAQGVTGTFVPIEVPGAQLTAARAITDDGRIVGFFTDGNGLTHGFLLVDGSFTSIDVPIPGARSTSALGINSRGDIVGSWDDSNGATHGFVLPAYGTFTVIDFENAILTTAYGINAAGDIVGQYDTSEKRYGYLRSRAGVFTSIDLPNTLGPPSFGTSATKINERGDIVGSYFDGTIHGYLLSSGTTTHTQLDVPGGVNAQARDINPQGDIVGFYFLGSRIVSFMRDRHGNYESFEAPTVQPAAATAAFGVNARGDIVGSYNYLGVVRGFVMHRTPTP
jgi:probable HAF family extracellular repeat protein